MSDNEAVVSCHTLVTAFAKCSLTVVCVCTAIWNGTHSNRVVLHSICFSPVKYVCLSRWKQYVLLLSRNTTNAISLVCCSTSVLVITLYNTKDLLEHTTSSVCAENFSTTSRSRVEIVTACGRCLWCGAPSLREQMSPTLCLRQRDLIGVGAHHCVSWIFGQGLGTGGQSALHNTHSQSCRNSACCFTKSEFLAGQSGEIRTGLLLHASPSVTPRLIYGSLMRNAEESTLDFNCSKSGWSGCFETFECWNFWHLLLDPDDWWHLCSSVDLRAVCGIKA